MKKPIKSLSILAVTHKRLKVSAAKSGLKLTDEAEDIIALGYKARASQEATK